MNNINVFSEIGKLKRVMLHRPGRELENLTPEYLERLLFDDIPYLEIAQQEHDNFASILRDNGAEVVYLTELLAESLSTEEIKEAYIDEVLSESQIFSSALQNQIKKYLLSKNLPEMIESVFAGIRKNEISDYRASALSDLLMSDYEFYMDPMPNLYFTRDPGASVGNGLIINKMKTQARQRETLALKYIHTYHPLFDNTKIWVNRDCDFSCEGGDELVLSDKVLAVGSSQRTSPNAIEIMAKKLFAENTGFEKVLAMEIKKCRAYMHLDTVLTMIDKDKFTVHPDVEQSVNVYEISKGDNGKLKYKHLDQSLERILTDTLEVDRVKLIPCGGGDNLVSMREQWNDGSNTLAIAPGVVVTYDRNYVSNELLDKNNVEVITIASSELSRGRGGPRCMSMPLYRDNL